MELVGDLEVPRSGGLWPVSVQYERSARYIRGVVASHLGDLIQEPFCTPPRNANNRAVETRSARL